MRILPLHLILLLLCHVDKINLIWNKMKLLECLQLMRPACKLPNTQQDKYLLPKLIRGKHNFHKCYWSASTEKYSALVWLLKALQMFTKTVIRSSCFQWAVINLKWILCHYYEKIYIFVTN